MNTPKNVALLLLAATTIGGALLAWKQYGELIDLRAAAMNKDERADLQKRVWDLEKLNRALQDQLAANRDPNAGAVRLAAGEEVRADGETRDRGPGRGGRGDPRGRGDAMLQQATAIRELMNKPEVQAMLNLQQKAAVEARYAALFKNLNLPPEQIEKLKTLLAERSTTVQDVMAAAAEQGVNPRDNPAALRKMIADAQNEINKGIKATIGDAGFAQLTSYEQTLPQRNLVNDLQQRLSYTNTPLTTAQAEQLVNILASTAPQRSPANAASGPTPAMPPPGARGPGGPGGPPPGGGFLDLRGGDLGGIIAGVMGGGPGLPGGDGRGPAATVTPAALAQAQGVLAPPQLAALQQIQQQQQTQQQLRQLVNDTLSANQPAGAKSGPPTKSGPAPGGTTPPTRRPGGG